MKILNSTKRKNSKFPMRIECEHCGSELEIEENDVHEGYLKMFYVICPVCGNETFVDENESEELTIDNLKFPTNFYSFKDGVDIEEKEIKDYIKRGIAFFRKNPEGFCWTTQCGNTFIGVFNYCGDGEYQIVVARDVFEVEIPFTDEDKLIVTEDKWKNKGVRIK